MRTLLILGGLVVCVLLVTPSDGDQTESRDGGGEKGTSDLREFFGQNEDGRADGIGSSSAIDQLRFRRQEPSSPSAPQKRKKCPGCFSAIASVEDPIKTKRSRRQEKKKEPSSPSNPSKRKKCPGCFSSLRFDDAEKLSKRERRQERKEPSSPSAPHRRKKCPGCFSSLIVTDAEKLSKRERRQERKNNRRKAKPSIKPPRANMYGLAARSTRTSRDTKPKRSKKLRVSGPDGLERKPKSDFGTPEKTPKDEGRRERKKTGRKQSREEKEERKLRKHHHHSHHRHSHHHHPEGEREEKKTRRTGSRSAITSNYGERKEMSDGKEVLERMKRQSGKGNRRKEKKDKWTVGSRSPIASLPG